MWRVNSVQHFSDAGPSYTANSPLQNRTLNFAKIWEVNHVDQHKLNILFVLNCDAQLSKSSFPNLFGCFAPSPCQQCSALWLPPSLQNKSFSTDDPMYAADHRIRRTCKSLSLGRVYRQLYDVGFKYHPSINDFWSESSERNKLLLDEWMLTFPHSVLRNKLLMDEWMLLFLRCDGTHALENSFWCVCVFVCVFVFVFVCVCVRERERQRERERERTQNIAWLSLVACKGVRELPSPYMKKTQAEPSQKLTKLCSKITQWRKNIFLINTVTFFTF